MICIFVVMSLYRACYPGRLISFIGRQSSESVCVVPTQASVLRYRGAVKPARFLSAIAAPSFNNSFSRLPVSTRGMSTLSDDFQSAKQKLNSLPQDTDNSTKLKLYALFKQGTEGKVSTSRPGMMDFVGRAKWDAWNELGDMSKEDAQKAYINYIEELLGAASESSQKSDTTPSGGEDAKYKYIQSTVDNGLRVIKLMRPEKKNALLRESYLEVIEALREAADDPETVITVTTGEGQYYSSGNDLSNFTAAAQGGDIKQIARDSGKLLNDFVSAFIDFPKPLIAVVNGPAIGVSVTVMGLYDAVFATDAATFHTPFSNLGQSPEGCSSYTFPRIMTPAKAMEVLLFNRKLTAHEAKEYGLVTEVLPDATFQQEIWPKLAGYAKLPAKSLLYSKALCRDLHVDLLHKVNDSECERLIERWTSEDCMNAIAKFFSRKSKL